MRSFVIREIRVLSRVEKAATSVKFSQPVTVIAGENDTGKSSLLKTIYWTLGCEPAKISRSWKDLDICAALTIEIDKQVLIFVRHGRRVALFDAKGSIIRSFKGITRDLAPFLADLFGFKLILTSRQGEPGVPPPAFYLLPYYMDQDASWSTQWSAFGGLGQYSDWKADVVEYHIGFRDAVYYEAKSNARALAARCAEPEQQLAAVLKAIEQIKSQSAAAAIVVDVDLDRFKREVEELLIQASRLAKKQETYRGEIEELLGKRSFLESQAQLATSVLDEISADYRFSLNQPEEVACPTCGETYSNSIVERFNLAVDQARCQDLLVEVGLELAKIDGEMKIAREALDQSRSLTREIDALLSTKSGTVSLKDVVQRQAREEAVQSLEAQCREIEIVVTEIQEAERAAIETMKMLDSKKRREDLRQRLKGLLDRFSIALNVPTPGSIKRFLPAVEGTGSDTPRSILAYQLSVLAMAWERKDALHAPLCIDSPNQQDQDLSNYEAMLKLIRDQRPAGQQLILALVNTAGIQFGGGLVQLTEKRRLLRREEYDTVGAEVEGLVSRMYAAVAS